MIEAKQPIGIFDSGIGGLTLAKAVRSLLPNEEVIYFGDTAHLPYGEKSTAAIQAYCIKICDFLLSKGCKLILIACNSASAAAYELACEYTASRAKVLNVIDPVVDYVSHQYHYPQKVGLIATRATVRSAVYTQKVAAIDPKLQLNELATPMLAAMIEEGFFNNNISKAVIKEYLSDEQLKDISALILGCTHYPLIKEEVNAFWNGEVEVIDASDMVARSVKAYLETMGWLNQQAKKGEMQYFVSDLTKSFQQTASIFFGEEVVLQQYKLWE